MLCAHNPTPELGMTELSGGNAEANKRPSDTLRRAWHDYPGEWLEESPSSEEEANRRVDTFRSLLRYDVALLLVDGAAGLQGRGGAGPQIAPDDLPPRITATQGSPAGGVTRWATAKSSTDLAVCVAPTDVMGEPGKEVPVIGFNCRVNVPAGPNRAFRYLVECSSEDLEPA